jgi:hypothetical protein
MGPFPMDRNALEARGRRRNAHPRASASSHESSISGYHPGVEVRSGTSVWGDGEWRAAPPEADEEARPASWSAVNDQIDLQDS